MSDSENLNLDQVLKPEIIEMIERRIAAGKLDDPFGSSSENLMATNWIHKESTRNLP